MIKRCHLTIGKFPAICLKGESEYIMNRVFLLVIFPGRVIALLITNEKTFSAKGPQYFLERMIWHFGTPLPTLKAHHSTYTGKVFLEGLLC